MRDFSNYSGGKIELLTTPIVVFNTTLDWFFHFISNPELISESGESYGFGRFTSLRLAETVAENDDSTTALQYEGEHLYSRMVTHKLNTTVIRAEDNAYDTIISFAKSSTVGDDIFYTMLPEDYEVQEGDELLLISYNEGLTEVVNGDETTYERNGEYTRPLTTDYEGVELTLEYPVELNGAKPYSDEAETRVAAFCDEEPTFEVYFSNYKTATVETTSNGKTTTVELNLKPLDWKISIPVNDIATANICEFDCKPEGIYTHENSNLVQKVTVTIEGEESHTFFVFATTKNDCNLENCEITDGSLNGNLPKYVGAPHTETKIVGNTIVVTEEIAGIEEIETDVLESLDFQGNDIVSRKTIGTGDFFINVDEANTTDEQNIHLIDESLYTTYSKSVVGSTSENRTLIIAMSIGEETLSKSCGLTLTNNGIRSCGIYFSSNEHGWGFAYDDYVDGSSGYIGVGEDSVQSQVGADNIFYITVTASDDTTKDMTRLYDSGFNLIDDVSNVENYRLSKIGLLNIPTAKIYGIQEVETDDIGSGELQAYKTALDGIGYEKQQLSTDGAATNCGTLIKFINQKNACEIISVSKNYEVKTKIAKKTRLTTYGTNNTRLSGHNVTETRTYEAQVNCQYWESFKDAFISPRAWVLVGETWCECKITNPSHSINTYSNTYSVELEIEMYKTNTLNLIG